MKTVLFVSHSSDYAGAEKSLYDIITHFDRSKYKVLVCLPDFGTQILYDRLNEYNDIRVFRLPYRHAVLCPTNIVRRITNALSHIAGSFLILKLIKKEKVDIVLSNTSWVCVGAVAARLGRVPHVWFIHESLEIAGARFILGNALYKKIIGWLSYAVVFNSPWTLTHYEKFIHVGKTRIIYNGFPFLNKVGEKFIPKEAISLREFNLGIVGTIAAHKGQLEAVKTLEILATIDARFKLHIFGQVTDPEYCHKIKRYVKNNNLSERVFFEGFISDISDVYPKIDILLVPSKVESFGRVVVEGIYYGCFVIAANDGGICEIIQHNENGVLLEDISPELMAKTVLALMSDEKLMAKIRKNAPQSISKYSLDSTIHAIENLFEEIFK